MIKHIFIALLLCGAFCMAAQAQTATPTPETVTISKEAAIKCLENGDKVTALEAEVKANAQAIADLKALISDLKANMAGLTGEKTQLEATLVRYDKILEFLLKNGRIKKYGIINL